MSPNRKGFTLIELLVVISIIGILAAVIVVAVNGARVKARDTKRKADMRTIQNALDSYYYKNSSYPVGIFFSPWSKGCGSTSWSCNGSSLYPPTCFDDHTPCTRPINQMAFFNALVGNNYLASLPMDSINAETNGPGTKGYLGDGPPTTGSALYDLGYLYYSDYGNGYLLGTNLEQGGGTNTNCGNYTLTGGDTQACVL